MDELKFHLRPISKKPPRRHRKGSKYDPILDVFLEEEADLVKVEIEEKDANYLRTQLNKRIEARDLENTVKTSVVNGVLYLEKL